MDTTDYVDMSLDDMIRDQRERKQLEVQQQESEEGISPFLRDEGVEDVSFTSPPKYNRSRFHPSYSNYLNHIAKKRVQRAHRTLDLRRRLIHLRTTKNGMDLRWKLVAIMISKLRAASQGTLQKRRYHPYQHPGLGGSHMYRPVMPYQPRVTQSSVSQLEKLVGKLPAWMVPAVSQSIPPGHPAMYPGMRSIGYGSSFPQPLSYSPGVQSFYGDNMPMMQHPVDPSVDLTGMPSLEVCMPQLDYEPMTRAPPFNSYGGNVSHYPGYVPSNIGSRVGNRIGARIGTRIGARIGISNNKTYVNGNDADQDDGEIGDDGDDIVIEVADEEGTTPYKRTLNERFRP